jgi:hypothetical protein
MFGYAIVGALVAGSYGMLHDEITFTLSSEYFTRLKFAQFGYADFGLPPRVFVAEIGFLATWWVGLMAGWFLARMVIPSFPPSVARRRAGRGFVIVFAAAFSGAIIGWFTGRIGSFTPEHSGLAELAAARGVRDVEGFVRVAYIHNCGYAGALVGLVLAVLCAIKSRTNCRE